MYDYRKAKNRFLGEVRDIVKIANFKPNIVKVERQYSKNYYVTLSIGGLVYIEDGYIPQFDEHVYFVHFITDVLPKNTANFVDFGDSYGIPIIGEDQFAAGYYEDLYKAVILALQVYVKQEIINELHTRWADEAERHDEYLASRR